MKKLILLCVLTFIVTSALAVTSNSSKRNPQEAAKFRATHACPVTGKIQRWCKGYVVDHIIPLCAGGVDDPSNMQWQDKQTSYRKDILERAEGYKLGTISPHTSSLKQ